MYYPQLSNKFQNKSSPRDDASKSSVESISPIEPIRLDESYTADSSCTNSKNNSSNSLNSTPGLKATANDQTLSVPLNQSDLNVQVYTDAQLLELMVSGNIPEGYQFDTHTVQRLMDMLDANKKSRVNENNDSNSQLSDITKNSNNNNSNLNNSHDSEDEQLPRDEFVQTEEDVIQEEPNQDLEPSDQEGQLHQLSSSEEKLSDLETTEENPNEESYTDLHQSISEGNVSDQDDDSSSDDCSVHSCESGSTIQAKPKRRHRRNRRLIRDELDNGQIVHESNEQTDVTIIPIRLKSTHECLDLIAAQQDNQVQEVEDKTAVGDSVNKQDYDTEKNVTSNSDKQDFNQSKPSTSTSAMNSESASFNNSNNTSTLQHINKDSFTNIPILEPSNSIQTDICYTVKWTKFNGVSTAVILQNLNGSCPLLTIVNILLLRRDVGISHITFYSCHSNCSLYYMYTMYQILLILCHRSKRFIDLKDLIIF